MGLSQEHLSNYTDMLTFIDDFEPFLKKILV